MKISKLIEYAIILFFRMVVFLIYDKNYMIYFLFFFEIEWTSQCRINYSIGSSGQLKNEGENGALFTLVRFFLGEAISTIHMFQKFSTFPSNLAFVNSMAVFLQFSFFSGIQITITKWIYNEELIYWIDKWLSQCHLTWTKCANNHYSSFEWRSKRDK